MNKIIDSSFLKNNTFIMVQLGKIINDKCYKVDIGEDNFMNLLEKFSNNIEFENIEIQDEKHFYLGDMCLVMNPDGDMICQKYKYNKYDIYKNTEFDIRITNYNYHNLNKDYFPGITEYNDIRRLNKMSFYKNNVIINMKIITYIDKYITYEIDINTTSDNHKELILLLNEIFTDLNVTKIISRKFNNRERITKTIF